MTIMVFPWYKANGMSAKTKDIPKSDKYKVLICKLESFEQSCKVS